MNAILTGQIKEIHLNQLLNLIMSGVVVNKMITQTGETVCTRDGVEIYASRTL